jgi:hypothetical protein
MSAQEIAAVKAHDRFDAIALGKRRIGPLRAIARHVAALWSEAKGAIRKWLR